jgi:hypothetical protein
VAIHTFKCRLGFAVLRARIAQKFRELRHIADRIEPRIIGHGWITAESTPNDSSKQLNRSVFLLQVCQVTHNVEQTFRIADPEAAMR